MEDAQDQPRYDATEEVTWFISATKEDSWSEEKFLHEYGEVHANMVRESNKHSGLPLRYEQVSAKGLTNLSSELYPGWDFVTCLRWPSTFVIWKGFQNPRYQETAGKHIFCRLDQKGCVAKKVVEVSLGNGQENKEPFHIFIFHRRQSSADEADPLWCQQRAEKAGSFGNTVRTYICWKDVTPKDTTEFFKGTQFSGGSWLEFKAVEQFTFSSPDDAFDFFRENRSSVLDGCPEAPYVTGGKGTLVVQ